MLVSLFALIGDVVRPKRFAGIFGGAPSVALATLALATAKSGALIASLEARSMILSSLGFVGLVVFGATAWLALPRYRAAVALLLAGAQWLAVSVSLWWLRRRA